MLLTPTYAVGVESILVDESGSQRVGETINGARMRNTRHNDGIDPDDREQILLDDLRVEIRRLADAVERQNELLESALDRPKLDITREQRSEPGVTDAQ